MIEKDGEVTSRWFSSNPLFEQVESELPEMPKTDKELRKEKRKSAIERKERRDERRRKEADVGYELVSSATDVKSTAATSKDETEVEKVELTQEKKDLIRAGMGLALKKEDKSEAFQVVRKYDSDHEEYDAEDRAKTLALGSMMLTHSKAKEMMDSSYNRYAWNDPEGLPEWFQDDEDQNYRPQVPVPKEVMDKMREKFIALASKPVKKVAEARMRKKKQELKKLKAAKKKAADIANLPDMSNREKMKSIEKTMKGAKLKKADKVYVVSTRGGRRSSGNSKAAKGQVKLVDPRMKSDKRLGKFKKKPKK